MNKRKKVLGIGLALALLVVPLGVVLADGILEITPGVLGVVDSPVDFGSVPFSFSSQSVLSVQPAVNWTVEDGTGNAAGFSVSMTSGDFINGAFSIPITTANGNLVLNIPGATIVCISPAGCTGSDPASDMFGGPAYALDNTTPRRIVYQDLASPGNGLWEFATWFDLAIPGGQEGGNYTSIWTVTVAAGP